MAVARKHPVKLKIPLDFLKTLPAFATPKAKKPKAGEKKDPGSPSGGPEESALPSSKINTGAKDLSTAGLTIHPVNATFALDKSGKPCKKWTRGSRQFKTFSGFKVKVRTWKQKHEKVKEPELDETPAVAVAE